MAVLDVTELRAGYGDTEILHGINMSVDDGEIVTIIGPNGSGKSTLMKSVVGIVDVSAGKLALEGVDITGVRADLRIPMGICYVPQTENVFGSLTIQENLEMGGYLIDAKRDARIEEMYERFPVLHEKRGAKAGSLSGGQRQTLAFARALMLHPTLLLLDEPSAGLSPIMVDGVFELIQEINGSGVAILMVEQNARRALSISDRAYVFASGEVRLTAPGEALIDNPEVARLYLGGGDEESGR